MSATRVVDAVNVKERHVIDEHGSIGDIESFLDVYGEETDDPGEYAFAIVQWRDDQRWSPIDLSDFCGYRH
ncbi:hypothetical protein [Hyphomicrobium sp. DY-1]|uniref:hypothetical protein n=1 Tax=Hyphomicrobium sp. DY-1 TaxID=3075650 RepID=UPI0039C19499